MLQRLTDINSPIRERNTELVCDTGDKVCGSDMGM